MSWLGQTRRWLLVDHAVLTAIFFYIFCLLSINKTLTHLIFHNPIISLIPTATSLVHTKVFHCPPFGGLLPGEHSGAEEEEECHWSSLHLAAGTSSGSWDMHSILKGEESFEDNKDRDRNKSNLRATPPGLVWSDKKVGCHKKGSILGRGHHVVSLVPDPLIHALCKQGGWWVRNKVSFGNIEYQNV